MLNLTAHDLIFVLTASLMVLGVLSIASGIILLVVRGQSKAVHTIANQTARLAQKGIADDVAGLVGNASSLIEALNQLSRTNAGIGIFLVIFGFLMVIAAFFMTKTFA